MDATSALLQGEPFPLLPQGAAQHTGTATGTGTTGTGSAGASAGTSASGTALTFRGSPYSIPASAQTKHGGRGRGVAIGPAKDALLFVADGMLGGVALRVRDDRDLALEVNHRKMIVGTALSLWHVRSWGGDQASRGGARAGAHGKGGPQRTPTDRRARTLFVVRTVQSCWCPVPCHA